MTVTISPVANTQLWSTWLARQNQVIAIIAANAVTTDTSAAGGVTTGNGTVNGVFGATTLFANTVRGGNITTPNTLTITSNVSVQNNATKLFGVSSNTTFSNAVFAVNTMHITADLHINVTSNTTTFVANAIVGLSNTFNLTSNAVITGSSSFRANATHDMFVVNAAGAAITANATTMTLNANTTFNGSNVVANADVNVLKRLTVTNTATLSNTLTVTGATVLSNTIAVTGAATLSNTVAVTGAATLSNTLIVAGHANLQSTANITGATWIGGSTTIANNLAVSSNATITGSLAVTSNVTFSNTLSVVGSATVGSFQTGNATFINAVSFSNTISVTGTSAFTGLITAATANVTGDLFVRGNLAVTGNLTYTGVTSGDIVPTSNAYALGNTTSRWTVYALSINVANGITVSGSNSNFNSGLWFVDTTNNRIGVGNTTPGSKLTVNGVIESTSGGVKFPDGTTLTTATSVAGSNTYVQFNSSGVLSGSANLTFDQTLGALSISNTIVSSTVNTAIVNLGARVTQYSNTFTFANTSEQTIDAQAVGSSRSAEFLLQLTDTGTLTYQVSKILVVHDGTSSYMTEYGSVYTGGILGTFRTTVSGGNINLLCTPATANVVIKHHKINMVP